MMFWNKTNQNHGANTPISPKDVHSLYKRESNLTRKVKSFPLFCLIICFHLGINGSYANIMLKKNSEFTCVPNKDDALFFDPPIVGTAKNRSTLLTNNEVFSNEWQVWNSANLDLAPVIDKRWEDFETIYKNHHMFGSVEKSGSFSLFKADIVDFFFDDGVTLDYYSRVTNFRTTWVHYTLVLNNNNIFIFENSKFIHSYSGMTPTHIIVKTTRKVYWKIHDYQVRMSTFISRKAENIMLPSNGGSCWMLYAALCPHCQLEIVYSEISKTLGGSKNSLLSEWQHLKLNNSAKKLELTRRTNNNAMKGVWAIDIRECGNVKSDKITYKGQLGSEEFNSTCKTLSQPSQSSPLKSIELLKCRPGLLGQDCDISCSDLFDLKSKFCEGYKICLDTKCSCLWGYRGELCDQVCENGTWGLDCKHNCTQCSNCDNITGDCKNANERVVSSSWLLVILCCLCFGLAYQNLTYVLFLVVGHLMLFVF